tara:strand:- start:39 stop:218 length:180 start_codon:yes stop_codon:yes gene_type:complete
MAFPTNPIYKLIKNRFTNQDDGIMIQVGSDLKSIPFDDGNTDYQEYLEWAKTNTAEPAD